MKDFNWDEIQESLSKAVKLDKNKDDLTVTITVIEENMPQNEMMNVDMLKGEDEMKKSLAQFINNGKPVECTVITNEEEKSIMIKFKEKKIWKKSYTLFNDMFFGDFFKKMIEAMMGAFKNFAPSEDDFKMPE